MTTTNDKLRSLFLAALMVFSVFAMTVAIPGSAAANHESIDDYDADEHLESGERYWGQTVLVQTNADDQDYELYEIVDEDDGDYEFVRSISPGNDNIATFSTDGLDGDYEIRAVGEDNATTVSDGVLGEGNGDATFSVTTQTLDAEFEDANVNDEDDNVELSIDTNRGTTDLNVSADGLDADELRDIFTTRDGEFDEAEDLTDDDTLVLDDVRAGDYRTNFTDVDTGEYTFDFEAYDTEASSSSSINVSDAAEGDIQFADDVPQDEVGDIADITLEFDNNDEGTITIGSEDQNYWLVAEVTDDDEDGEVTVQFNSYAAGSFNASASNGGDILEVDDSDDSVNVTAEGGSFADNNENASDGLLDSTEYDMNVSVEHIDRDHDDYDDPSDVGSLSLQDRSTDGVSTLTAPEAFDEWDDADAIIAGAGSNVTEASDIAQQDYAIVQIQASGLEGYYESVDEDAFLNGDAATELLIEQADAGANVDDQSLSWSAANENYEVVADADNNTYYVALDTEELDEGDDNFNFEADEEYTSEFSVLGGDDDYSPTDDYAGDDDGENVLNFHDDDDDEVVSGNFGVVEGESELNLNEDDLVAVEAAENQSVSGTTNWAPGTELTVRISSDDATSPFLTQPSPEVQPNGTFEANSDFSELSEGTNLTIQINHLSEELEEDGVVVAEGEIDDGQDGNETETDTPTEEPETDTPTEEPETDTPTEEPDTGTDTPTPTDDSGPGFTVIAALGALIAAALLAVRRNN